MDPIAFQLCHIYIIAVLTASLFIQFNRLNKFHIVVNFFLLNASTPILHHNFDFQNNYGPIQLILAMPFMSF